MATVWAIAHGPHKSDMAHNGAEQCDHARIHGMNWVVEVMEQMVMWWR